ncbi:MAG: hypothetical protein ACREPE_12410 [Lysobacter sp.]
MDAKSLIQSEAVSEVARDKPTEEAATATMNGDLRDDAKEASDELDAALAATFPASDPPVMTAPVVAMPPAAGAHVHAGTPITVYRV